ncbi:MAG: hypothetical protein JWN88_2171 [Frankiales bacterium]|jgi:hypothetical protein|nr:hypothetical protein [Frankiales bacterium]
MNPVTHMSPRASAALRIYADTPMDEGDAVLLLDDEVCLEFGQLTTGWDDESRRRLAQMLDASASRVLLAIARDGGRLLPRDYQIWRELHEELRSTRVELLPVRALPAA